MPVTRFACPACHLILQPGNPLEEGRKIKCQECGVIFPVKQLDESQVPPVATAVVVPTPGRRRRRQEENASQWQEYERRQEQNRNVMIALGAVLALLLISGLVVGL